MTDEERISDLSHWLCACISCDCPGDGNGANPETAKCFLLAKKMIALPDHARAEAAKALIGS